MLWCGQPVTGVAYHIWLLLTSNIFNAVFMVASKSPGDSVGMLGLHRSSLIRERIEITLGRGCQRRGWKEKGYGGRSNQRRSNQRRSNQRRSNQRRSNQRRSNQRRSNQRRSNDRRSNQERNRRDREQQRKLVEVRRDKQWICHERTRHHLQEDKRKDW